MIIVFIVGTGIVLFGGILAFVFGRNSKNACVFGATSAVAGSLLTFIFACQALIQNVTISIRVPWSVPFASFHLVIDPLASFFIVVTSLLSIFTSLYGYGYLLTSSHSKRAGAAWLFFNLLITSLLLVLSARNGVLFLIAWEIMALASFCLVIFDSTEQAIKAGRLYLVASHIGTAFLLVLFILLAEGKENLDFSNVTLEGARASVIFLLALMGFGMKAGFVPLHVWLPEAHPAAPSHVSALMSGVMIKMGIYGLLRIFSMVTGVPAWWGWLLIAIGLSSGIIGILFALAQRDLKRLLAYSSVENIGIIALALGLGLLGVSLGLGQLAFFGFLGALMHVLNHALFKGLLFLNAGSVIKVSGLRRLDEMGGLFKKMPWTGLAAFFGALAASGLPPFNGFIGEFLIYLGSGFGILSRLPEAHLAGLVVLGGLALIGGLSAVCFVKMFGIVFLGEGRSQSAREAHEAPLSMRWSQAGLAVLCLVSSFFSPFLARGVARLFASFSKAAPAVPTELPVAFSSLTFLSIVLAGLILIVMILIFLRQRLVHGRPYRQSLTWGCGYASPAVRAQYTGSSFTAPLLQFFKFIVEPKRKFKALEGIFPASGELATETPDVFREKFYRPFFSRARAFFAQFRFIQHGRLQLYILYVAAALLILIVWKLR